MASSEAVADMLRFSAKTRSDALCKKAETVWERVSIALVGLAWWIVVESKLLESVTYIYLYGERLLRKERPLLRRPKKQSRKEAS